jgi:hypothetical protein
VGPLEGLPISVAAGYGADGLAWAPLAATWAVDSIVGGRRDPVPAAFHVTRALADS